MATGDRYCGNGEKNIIKTFSQTLIIFITILNVVSNDNLISFTGQDLRLFFVLLIL